MKMILQSGSACSPEKITGPTPHRILMFFMKWKKTQMRQTQSYQKKHALVLLQDSMSESVNPFHLKGHSPFPVRTCVFKCLFKCNVSHCLSSALFTYLVSLLSVQPFCCTASAPYTKLA